jgi:hypothetical protein
MRKGTWIRFGLVSAVALGGAGVSLGVGCGGDDTGVATDAGHDTHVTPIDAPTTPTDSPTTPRDAARDAPVPLPDAKIIVVHASPDLPPVRFCFATQASGVAPYHALPDTTSSPLQPFPGLFPGTGGALPDVGVSLAQSQITGYLILAQNIAGQTHAGAPDGGAEATCVDLIGADGSGGLIHPGTDYFPLAPIPAGTFLDGTTELIAVAGCLPSAVDPNAGTARCGTSYNGTTGNLATQVYKLDTTTAQTSTSFGTQVIHAASAWDGVFTAVAGGPVFQAFDYASVTGVDDAGQPIITPGPSPILPLNYPQAATGTMNPTPNPAQASDPLVFTNQANTTDLVTVTTFTATSDPDAGFDGGPAPFNTFALPVFAVGDLSVGPGPDGGLPQAADGGNYFQTGENYTWVLLGDPTACQLDGTNCGDAGAGGYIGFGLHIVAFPNNIGVTNYQP